MVAGISEEAVRWTKEHAVGFEIGNRKEHDFSFLDPLLADKQIVLLGENGHGVAEHFLIKSHLIAYLHRKLGFEVIVFESGMGECDIANGIIRDQPPEEAIKSALFSVWHCRELVPLFDYMKCNIAAERPLRLAGLDIQMSSNDMIFTEHLTRALARVNPEFAREVKELEQSLHDKIHSKRGGFRLFRWRERKERTRLLAAYRKLAAFLRDHEQVLTGDNLHPNEFRMLMRTVENRLHVVEMQFVSLRKAIQIRDRAMADNLRWLAEHMYPDKKIAVWAHNGHIAKKLKHFMGFTSMGHYFPPDFQRKCYSVGFFMHEGRAANNDGTVYDVQEPPEKSIEYLFKQTGLPYAFLDVSGGTAAEPGAWVHSPAFTMDAGLAKSVIKPSEQYDALLYCERVHPPTYLTKKEKKAAK